MQLDFHYYCIGALARMSGFLPEQALTIAYASQYVDDATESEPVRVGDIRFDPVRTAHKGLTSFTWDVQQKIYMAFHFIPPYPVDSLDASFVTAPGSPFAARLWERAISESDGLMRLCFIGTALHTIADATSHSCFSGRRNKENDVEAICLFQNGEYRHLFWQNLLYDLWPQIGHAEAGAYPDLSFLKWRYKNHSGNEIVRNNPGEYLKAAEIIFNDLCEISPKEDTVHEWDEISGSISGLLLYEDQDLQKRCSKWRDEFSESFQPEPYLYDRLEWRRIALAENNDDRVSWDKKRPSHFATLRFEMSPGFFDSAWVNFHRAALRHRDFVLENMV